MGEGGGGRKGGVSPFSVKKILSQCQKFRIFIVSLLSGKNCFVFSPKLFCLVPRHFFVEVFFCAVFQKISGAEKVYE